MQHQHLNYIQKTDDLINRITVFSDNLPYDEIYDLKTLIKTSIKGLSKNIEDTNNMNRSFDIIKAMIKVNSSLEECREYLVMVKKLRLADSDRVVEEIKDYSNTINKSITSKIS